MAWKQSGADPYRLYNGLGDDYRPLGRPEEPPRPPQFPERVRTFIYAAAMWSRELDKRDQAEQAAMMRGGGGGRR